MFKVSGRWVSPYEIESVLVQYPEVLEAAVIGRKDEHGLIHADAWVVLKEPTSSGAQVAEDLRHFCEAILPRYKLPGQIHIVDKLPKTATGKIQRYKLRVASAHQDRLSHKQKDEGLVLVERVGRVVIATLSRRPVNALNDELIEHFDAVLDQVIDDQEVTVLHIRSDQQAFCAGADLALMQSCFGTLKARMSCWISYAACSGCSRESSRRPWLRSPKSAARPWEAVSNWHSPAIFAWPRSRRSSACRRWGWAFCPAPAAPSG